MKKTLNSLLRFVKKVIKPIVKPLALTTAILFSSALSNKLNAQTPTWYQAFNPRNEVVDGLNSYGMPEIDGDGKLTWDDYNLMDSNPSHQTDIDADDVQSSTTDKQIYADYLNGIIAYLPGEYWRSTPSEKDSWIRKVYPIITRLNNREFIPPSDSRAQDPETRFDCTNGVVQDILSMNGYSPNRDDFGLIHSKYTLEYNGLFNLPAYFAGVHSDDGTFNHAVTAIFTGTNLNNLDGWLFLESMTGKVVEPGSLSIPYNSEIKIKGIHNFKDGNIIDQPFLWPAVRLHIDGTGNREMTYLDSNMVKDQTSLAVEDDENTNISNNYSLKQNFPNPFNSSTTINYTLDISANVEFNFYDITGHIIDNISIGYMNVGSHRTEYNSRDLSSGIYFYQLNADGLLSKHMKMTVLK